MKTMLAATLIAGFPIGCLADQIPFYGMLQYTAGENCVHEKPGFRYKSVYMPSNLGDNGPSTFLNQVFDFGATGYRITGRFKPYFRHAEAHSTGFGAWQFQVPIKITSSLPADADLTATTSFVSLTGVIKRPQGDSGIGDRECIMEFIASYTRLDKPD